VTATASATTASSPIFNSAQASERVRGISGYLLANVGRVPRPA
jgi:hypothetical protein